MKKYRIYKLTNEDKANLNHPNLHPTSDYFCLFSNDTGLYFTPNNELLLYQTTTKQDIENPKKKLKLAQCLEAYNYFYTFASLNNIPFKEQTPLELANQSYSKNILYKRYTKLDIDNENNIFPNTIFLNAAKRLIDETKNIQNLLTSNSNNIENTMICDKYNNDYQLLDADFELEYI